MTTCMKWLLALALLAPLPAALAESPYDAVLRSTDELLAKLAEVEPLFDQDQEKFYAEVDAALTPYIDFEGFAKGVMGKHYRSASDGQRSRFQQTFKELLTRTYAKALVGFDNQRVQVLPPDADAANEDGKEGDRASVHLEVHGSSGDIYPVQYQLVQKGGSWLLRNLIVNGINIGFQFRSQFGASMERHKKDMDAVIANWSVDVQRDSSDAER